MSCAKRLTGTFTLAHPKLSWHLKHHSSVLTSLSASVMSTQVVDQVALPSQEHHSKLQFVLWLQFHLHLQLLGVSDYAESKHVALKGDLPIGMAVA